VTGSPGRAAWLVAGLALLSGSAGACRERAAAVLQESKVDEAVTQLMPVIERAAGMRFRRRPVVAIRSRDQLHAYLRHKLDEDLPPDRVAGMTAAYRLFGMIPETLNLRQLLLDLLGEQVVGYFDPDSGALYVVAGVDPEFLRTTLAHELVHALQAQYLDVDSLMSQPEDDRAAAARALFEGHATWVQTVAAMPEKPPSEMPSFYSDLFRRNIVGQQGQMPVFARAPLVVREAVVFFPYLAGADFARWYGSNRRNPFPTAREMPASSEQILHPDRYARGDAPVRLAFAGGPERGSYESQLGEIEIRVLFTQITGRETDASGIAQGWGGDRYRVYVDDRALVWYTVWDDSTEAHAFEVQLRRGWPSSGRGEGRRVTIEAIEVDGRPAVRLVDAPAEWAGWRAPPSARLAQ
jgi:hypothetical protein